MHVDLSDILHRDSGEQTELIVQNELPDLEDVSLARPLDGRIQIYTVDDDLVVDGRLQTALQLACDRCLQEFTYPLQFQLTANFSVSPKAEQYAIDRSGVIDLSPAVRQEIILQTPYQKLCRADCAGILLEKN